MPPALLQNPLKSSSMPSDPVTVIVHELLLQQLWCLCEGHHSKGKFPSGNLSQWICNKKLATTGIMRPTYPTFKNHWLPHISTPLTVNLHQMICDVCSWETVEHLRCFTCHSSDDTEKSSLDHKDVKIFIDADHQMHLRKTPGPGVKKYNNNNNNNNNNNKQQTTNNKQQTTNNKQQTTNNKQQTTNNKQQTTNNKQQTTNNKQQTTNNKQQTTNNKHQPTTNNQQPTTNNNNNNNINNNNQQPTTNKRQTTNDKRQTTNNKQQPTTNNQQPTTNNQQPTTNNQQPTTNNQQQQQQQQHRKKNSQLDLTLPFSLCRSSIWFSIHLDTILPGFSNCRASNNSLCGSSTEHKTCCSTATSKVAAISESSPSWAITSPVKFHRVSSARMEGHANLWVSSTPGGWDWEKKFKGKSISTVL